MQRKPTVFVVAMRLRLIEHVESRSFAFFFVGTLIGAFTMVLIMVFSGSVK
jgi:hypothetical protein